jgi:hypothetical protein
LPKSGTLSVIPQPRATPSPPPPTLLTQHPPHHHPAPPRPRPLPPQARTCGSQAPTRSSTCRSRRRGPRWRTCRSARRGGRTRELREVGGEGLCAKGARLFSCVRAAGRGMGELGGGVAMEDLRESPPRAVIMLGTSRASWLRAGGRADAGCGPARPDAGWRDWERAATVTVRPLRFVGRSHQGCEINPEIASVAHMFGE